MIWRAWFVLRSWLPKTEVCWDCVCRLECLQWYIAKGCTSYRFRCPDCGKESAGVI